MTYADFLFYFSWIIIILSSIWIGVEVAIWSKFLNGIKTNFFRFVIGFIVIYVVINIFAIFDSLYIVKLNNLTFLDRYDFLMQTARVYLHPIISVCLAILMRIVNHRSANANLEIQKLIQEAAISVSYSKKQFNESINLIDRMQSKLSQY